MTHPAGPDQGGWALAVDVGTSNTTAAVRTADGRVVPVRLSEAGFSMPSAVLVDGADVRVGVDASRRRMSRPGSYEASPKRRLPELEIQLDGRDCEVVDLVAELLRHALAQARPVAGGSDPVAIALTHPEPWAPRRRRQLLEAARRAGYDVERTWLVSEPVAAAQSYASRAPVPDGAVVAVFDFGGGTCDVAVLAATPAPTTAGEPPRPFTVLASRGLDPLGGSDLDHHLAVWVEEQLVTDGRKDLLDDLAEDLRATLTLREEIQAAKHELSRQASAGVEVVVGRDTHELTITVGEFESLIEADIDRAVALMRSTLVAAGTRPDAVHALYLTGGSSMLPIVHRRLEALLGRTPATLDDPKLVVVTGALSVPHRELPATRPVAPPVRQQPPQRAPAQQRPAQPSSPPPAQQRPVQPVQQRPVQQRPPQQRPVQQPPVQQRPIQQRPPQQRPVQQRPIQQRPVQQRPPQPVHQRPVPTAAPSPALQRLLAAQPGLATSLAPLPRLLAAIDNERDLLALVCAPGLLERLRHDPVRTVEQVQAEVRIDGDPIGRDGTRTPWSLLFSDHPPLLAQVRDRDRRVRDRATVHEALLLLRVLSTTPGVSTSRTHDLARLLALPGFTRRVHVPWVLHGTAGPRRLPQTIVYPHRPVPAFTDPTGARHWPGTPSR